MPPAIAQSCGGRQPQCPGFAIGHDDQHPQQRGGIHFPLRIGLERQRAAAIEGAFFGITSVAVSLEWDEHADYDRAAEIAIDVIGGLLDRRPAPGSLFNLNIPTRALQGVPELRVVPMGVFRYGEAFERRVDPRGRAYYWATNDPPPPPSPVETDVAALAAGAVTLTPLEYDLTHRAGLDILAAGTWRIGPAGS